MKQPRRQANGRKGGATAAPKPAAGGAPAKKSQAPAERIELGPSRAVDAGPAAAGTGDGPSSSGSAPSRVVYIGHLPHGFYEKQLLGFFSQFGRLTRVRLSRNKKTGKAKHYAFLEFQYAEVAQVAAEAMNGYFMFSQKLDVKLVPVDKIHPQLFKGANRRFRSIPWARIERKRHDKELTPQELAVRVARAIKKDKQRQRRIAEAGIEYEYPPLMSLVPAKPKKTLFDD